jgi:hypothetical protein
MLFAGFLLFALARFARADDGLALPSQNPALVLPMLRHFSPKDLSKPSVMKKLKAMLGSPWLESIHGPGGASDELFCLLSDNKTMIHIYFLNARLLFITREVNAHVVERLYLAKGR